MLGDVPDFSGGINGEGSGGGAGGGGALNSPDTGVSVLAVRSEVTGVVVVFTVLFCVRNRALAASTVFSDGDRLEITDGVGRCRSACVEDWLDLFDCTLVDVSVTDCGNGGAAGAASDPSPFIAVRTEVAFSEDSFGFAFATEFPDAETGAPASGGFGMFSSLNAEKAKFSYRASLCKDSGFFLIAPISGSIA